MIYRLSVTRESFCMLKRGWDKNPSLSIVFGLSSKTQWLSGLYYADFISFYIPTQLCGGGTTKSNSNELNSRFLSHSLVVSSRDRCRKQCLGRQLGQTSLGSLRCIVDRHSLLPGSGCVCASLHESRHRHVRTHHQSSMQ